ncbi:MAG: ADP-ribosylglycohydrolase family protein [Actinomycetes bacterium]|nr:MAG: hypothetical protein DIU67_06310 [Actinomycetota bacterium]
MEDPSTTSQEPERHPHAPLFRLVNGEGDGAILGIAAGDTAGGAWELGYSAITAQAAVIAYELIEHGRIRRDGLRAAILELDGSLDEEPVYRAETPSFRAWLDRARAGEIGPNDAPSNDGLSRAVVVGVAFRKHPDRLVDETLALCEIFDREPGTVAACVMAAAAAAALSYAQSGMDLISGVAEVVIPAIEVIDPDGADAPRLAGLEDSLKRLLGHVGVTDGQEALEVVGGDVSDPLQAVQAGMLLAAVANERPHLTVEQAARIGGSPLAAFVGGIVGARVGIRAWPWPFANDTWFAELGRRLVRGPYSLEGLPIPYAVEQHLTYGTRPDYL